MPTKRARKLVDIDLGGKGGNSGVDHPAHQVEGWLLMKGRDPDPALEADIEEVLAQAVALEKAHGELITALESAKPYLEEAPETVRAAVNTLYDWLKGMPADLGPESADVAPSAEPTEKGSEPDAPAVTRKSWAVRALARLFGGSQESVLTPDPSDRMSALVAEVEKAAAIPDGPARIQALTKAVAAFLGASEPAPEKEEEQ